MLTSRYPCLERGRSAEARFWHCPCGLHNGSSRQPLILINRYEFYYDVIHRGQYTFEIPRLHEKYGPVIRINPHEVHISDPDFYDTLYAGPAKKRDKWSWFTDSFGIPDSTFSAVKHDVHRVRRAALDPYFSKAKVRSLQPQIEDVVAKLLARFAEFRKTGEPMTVSLAFAAVTNGMETTLKYEEVDALLMLVEQDIAMLYAFGRNENRIQAHDFDPSFHDASVAGSTMSHFLKQFPWVLSIMQSLPDSVAVRMNPDMGSYVKMQECKTHFSRSCAVLLHEVIGLNPPF